VLLPGEVVYVPPAQPKWIEARPGNLYVLLRKGTESRLKIRLTFGMEPLTGFQYLLQIPGFPDIVDNTNDQGEIDRTVPATTSDFKLTFGPWPLTLPLKLETLAPLADTRGVQQRLINLGYPCPSADFANDFWSAAYLRRFQEMTSEEPTGLVTEKVCTELLRVHDRR
jgi:N-acetylmuramoyl-L-alanine amidase